MILGMRQQVLGGGDCGSDSGADHNNSLHVVINCISH
jgi:hypothetical protein